MANTLKQGELFDSEFLEAALRLRIVPRRVAARGRFAEHRSRDRGNGFEFQDYRPYTPGDDLRSIDWNVYRRLGKVFLRLFEELEDLPLYLLPDVSDSLWLEEPPRVRAGLRTALALAAISLGQHDSVGVFPIASDVTTLQRPKAGKGRIFELAQRLGGLEPGGQTDLVRSLSRFGSLGLRPGLAVVISDFFDPGGIEAVTKALSGLRHRLLLVQLIRGVDREPKVSGDVLLVDCESGVSQELSVSRGVLDAYRASYDRFQTGLAALARSRGAGLLALDADQPVVPQLASLFEHGRFEV